MPVMIGDAGDVQGDQRPVAGRYAIYLQPINYPTVPRGTERLRLTPSPLHTDADIAHLAHSLTAIWSDLHLRHAA